MRQALFVVTKQLSDKELLIKSLKYWRQTYTQNYVDIKDNLVKDFLSSFKNPEYIWNLLKSEVFL